VALAEMGRLTNLVSAQHLEDAKQCPSSQAFRRRNSVSATGQREEDTSGDARRGLLNVADGKSADEQRRRRHSVSGVVDDGVQRHRRRSIPGTLEIHRQLDAHKFTRLVPPNRSPRQLPTNGSPRRNHFSRQVSAPAPDDQSINGELHGGAHQPNRPRPPVVARRRSVAGTDMTREGLSPIPAEGKPTNGLPRGSNLARQASAPDGQSINVVLDAGTRQPNSARTLLFTQRKSAPETPPGILRQPRSSTMMSLSEDRPASSCSLGHGSKDKALTALRLSSPKHCKCCFCVKRAEDELPEMVKQIVERLLKEGMAIEKVAEIIGVGQAVIEKIDHNTAGVTLENGDGKATEPEAEAITISITTAATRDPIKGTDSETSELTIGDSVDESPQVTVTGLNDCVRGG